MRPYFRSCTKSFEAKLLTNHDSALITFNNVADAKNALKTINGKKRKGTEILLALNRPSRIVKLQIPSGVSDETAEDLLESKFSQFQVEIDISQVAGQKSAILRFPTEPLSVQAVNTFQEFNHDGWIWHLEFIRVTLKKYSISSSSNCFSLRSGSQFLRGQLLIVNRKTNPHKAKIALRFDHRIDPLLEAQMCWPQTLHLLQHYILFQNLRMRCRKL